MRLPVDVGQQRYGNSSDMLEVGGRLRVVIEDRLAEAELDGFLAAWFLDRYEHEGRWADLSWKIAELESDFTFTRSNVALLGLALEVEQLSPTPERVHAFVEAFDRLERQQTGSSQAVSFGDSLKLMWGVALGAIVPSVRAARPDVAERVAQRLATFKARSTTRLRDVVLTTSIQVQLTPQHREVLARELAHKLLGDKLERLADGDVLAALWALRSRCFSLLAWGPDEREAKELHRQLLPRMLRLKPIEDVVDALLADHLWGELLRDTAAGGVVAGDALSVTLQTIDTFHELVRRLRDRKHHRPPFLVENEYDVQDLLYVTLKPSIPDLSDEEWTPKDAGAAKRIDFVSQAARLCIEAKMARDSQHARQIADDLRVDFESYYVHAACERLVVFVYDPNNHLADAAQIEIDLSGRRTIKGRSIDVLVRVRPQ